MNRYLRGAAVAALTLAASAALTTAASAQTYSRLVVFGDSLSDNGNLFIATGGASPTSPPYARRFSNGPVFTELLGFNAANFNGSVAGSYNTAFGGSRTDNSVAFPIGMRQQLTNYIALGGAFRSTDLFSVLGGANNIFQALPAAGATSNPTGALTPTLTSAVADMNFIVGDIAQRGAGTILVTNLPRLGITPQFRTSPASPLADYAGSTFNSLLQASLLTLAPSRPNTNIILFDLAKVSDVLAANPGRFGLTNVTDQCLNTTTGVACSTPDTYLYWDGVHPTAAGHRLIAALANDYLYYGDLGAASTLQGETAYRHREDALEHATASLSGQGLWEAGTSMSFSGGYDQTDTDARGSVASASAEGFGARAALESGTETMRFGLAGSFQQADVDAGRNSFELQSIALDVYAGYRSGSAFVNVAAGVANDDYNDIERISSLQAIVQSGSTQGFSTGARAQAGLWLDAGGLAISPRVAITYADSDVDGYTEQGAAASYQYADRAVKGVTAEATLRAEADMGGFGLWAEGGYRDSLDDSSEAVRVGIAGNPAQVLSRRFDDPFGGSILASAGVSGDLGPVQVEVAYRGRFGDKADSNMGSITFRLPL